jgi:hypothetical protein
MLNTTPRLKAYEFVVPQFTSLFYNSKNIDTQLRSFFISSIEREKIINTIGAHKVRAVYNPFFSERLIESAKNEDFSLA